ncbi:molybdopterin synthase [Natronobiforma cellulositropha]|uniref:molybdopterin synthase n=1 Tax=Natronobiforma cellulositropha TaxID=1679076 RepID=UPI0021D57EFF|nr:molybdopterin synthase [Natronobiforma cellulositropha]
MQVLGVLDCGGGGETVERVVDRLVDAFAERGRVGVVRYDATIADGTSVVRDPGLTPGGDVTYDLGADGDWVACGTGFSIEDAVDALARDDCAYAVVVGHRTGQYPTVTVGADVPEGTDVVATVETPADLDLESLVDRVDEHEPHVTLETLVERVKRADDADRAGAIATFTGRVRARDSDDDTPTEYLEFEKYDGVADEKLAALREALEARDGVYAVELHHRTGVVRDGEDIVFVVVLAGHRAEAFRTVEDGINRLKAEVPIFKKEVTIDDEFWVHDRP